MSLIKITLREDTDSDLQLFRDEWKRELSSQNTDDSNLPSTSGLAHNDNSVSCKNYHIPICFLRNANVQFIFLKCENMLTCFINLVARLFSGGDNSSSS